MAENSDDLERLSREQLILKARVLGVERPELMTRVEMRDEIVRRSEPDLAQQKRARGFLGVARDLVASVVEAGLNLPDAAALIRGDSNRENYWKGPPPVATVTLAEIYAAQGHLDRALKMLDEVLAKEPDHDPARALRTRLANATDLPVAPARRRQKISFAENSPLTPSASEAVAQTSAEPVSVPDSAASPEPLSADATIASAPAEVSTSQVHSAKAAEFVPSDSQASAEASGPTVAEAPRPEGPIAAPASAELPAMDPASAPNASAAELPEAPESSISDEPSALLFTAEESIPSVSPAVEFPVTDASSSDSSAAAPAVAEEPPSASVASAEEPSPLKESVVAGELAGESIPELSPEREPAPSPPALLTLSLAGQRQIYWELPPGSLTELRAHSPSGRPIVRVISFRTRSGRVERHLRDLTPDSEVGFAVLPDLRADAVVRAVLGWEVAGRFMPFVIASDLASGSPSSRRNGPFRANPLVGPVSHDTEQRALSHCSRRPAH